MGIVEEEGDESVFWMEMLIDAKLVREKLLGDLMREANEIVSMVVSSIKTSRRPERRPSQK